MRSLIAVALVLSAAFQAGAADTDTNRVGLSITNGLFIPATSQVFFSPRGGCTEAVVAEINAATNQVLVQAYNFTSARIGDALAAAARRGVQVAEIQDGVASYQKAWQGPKLAVAGGLVALDRRHKIAHSKVIIVDGETVVTGSFNFSDNAENSNAENLLVVRGDKALAAAYVQNWSNHLAHAEAWSAPEPEGAP